ncbi:rhamnan synthesis F family protein [Nocardioides sp.]|uniref:rhamnan synthesis F family protein n=1 Tax=Nocardioides sp. TaxID=35761 RepID=UPI0039E67A8F
MAHYDPTGALGPHVRRQVTALASWFDDLVVVSTADLREESRRWLAAHARLVERGNEGYDFYSYKVGLDSADLLDYDEVAICNDTYVLLRDYADLFADMAPRPADFWGLTMSNEIKPHVQSFFVLFREQALRSTAFADFWAGMEPISARHKVIRRYEVGMSRRLMDAGLVAAGHFVPTDADLRMARLRCRAFLLRRYGMPRDREGWRRLRDNPRQGRWNPTAGLADRALDQTRLPFAKIDVFRYDPYGLDAEKLLYLCEEAMPDAFAGVRDFLAATAASYPERRGSELRAIPRWLEPIGARLRYRAP